MTIATNSEQLMNSEATQLNSKKILQPIIKAIEYGSIIAISVPMPVPLTYF